MDHSESDADIVVISIIPKIEQKAILAEFTRQWPASTVTELEGSTKLYNITTRSGWKVRVAIRAIYEAGNLASAIETTNLLSRFYPRFAFLCGIAGNLNHEKKNLGDVVVSGAYDYRVYTRMSYDGTMTYTHPDKPRISRKLFDLANSFFGSEEIDFTGADLKPFLNGRVLPHDPEVEIAKIFCWDMVLDCDDFRKELVKADREYRAVEMEAHGFLRAIEAFSKVHRHALDGLIFRGLSDPASGKASSDKGDVKWRPISARNAARAMVAFIDNLQERHCADDNF